MRVYLQKRGGFYPPTTVHKGRWVVIWPALPRPLEHKSNLPPLGSLLRGRTETTAGTLGNHGGNKVPCQWNHCTRWLTGSAARKAAFLQGESGRGGAGALWELSEETTYHRVPASGLQSVLWPPPPPNLLQAHWGLATICCLKTRGRSRPPCRLRGGL